MASDPHQALREHLPYHLGQLVVVRRLLGCWPEGG
jgi:hypothetical protein